MACLTGSSSGRCRDMIMADFLSKIAARNFGRQGLLGLESKIRNAGLSLKPMEVAKISVLLLAIFALFGIAVLPFFPIGGMVIFLLAMVAYRAPPKFLDYLAGARRKKLESELPFALRYFSQLLGIGLTPEAALSRIAKMDFGEISRLFGRAMDENKKGKMLETALRDLDRTVDSERLREAISVIIQTLRLGPSEEGNRISLRLARRMMEEKKGEYESFAAKSQILMVVQVAVSAIIPAVVAFVSAFGGGGFLGSGPLIYIVFLAVLPALSLAGFAYLKLVHPG